MAQKHSQPYDAIRERLEELFRLGASLQDYIKELRNAAPHEVRTKEVTDELLALETKLGIVNEILYQEKNSFSIERAIGRLRNKGISRKV